MARPSKTQTKMAIHRWASPVQRKPVGGEHLMRVRIRRRAPAIEVIFLALLRPDQLLEEHQQTNGLLALSRVGRACGAGVVPSVLLAEECRGLSQSFIQRRSTQAVKRGGVAKLEARQVCVVVLVVS